MLVFKAGQFAGLQGFCDCSPIAKNAADKKATTQCDDETSDTNHRKPKNLIQAGGRGELNPKKLKSNEIEKVPIMIHVTHYHNMMLKSNILENNY